MEPDINVSSTVAVNKPLEKSNVTLLNSGRVTPLQTVTPSKEEDTHQSPFIQNVYNHGKRSEESMQRKFEMEEDNVVQHVYEDENSNEKADGPKESTTAKKIIGIEANSVGSQDEDYEQLYNADNEVDTNGPLGEELPQELYTLSN